MTYILIYRAGSIPLSEDQKKANRQVWDVWNTFLKETYGIRTSGGKSISSDKVEDYKGNFKGASIIEANSLTDAVEIAKKCPILAYGGKVEVLEEY